LLATNGQLRSDGDAMLAAQADEVQTRDPAFEPVVDGRQLVGGKGELHLLT